MRNRGLTLLEVVLAIGLSAAVMALLATAIDLYLTRVDSSRTQVESAQLARALLGQIANDLRAARYFSPESATSSATSSAASSSSGTGTPDAAGTSAGSTTGSPLVQGIFGTQTELRVDRSAVWQWDLVTQRFPPAEAGSPAGTTAGVGMISADPEPAAMPQTVRYVLAQGKEMLAKEMAAAGVSEDGITTGYAGLYREQMATPAWLANNSVATTTTPGSNGADTELIAPEVAAIEFAYFDGQQLVTQWDSSVQQGLPSAVEIRLTLLREPFEQAVTRTAGQRDELRRTKENLVEYRLVVRLPFIQPLADAEFPPTGAASGGNGGNGNGGGNNAGLGGGGATGP